jgi:hypothetical protein
MTKGWRPLLLAAAVIVRGVSSLITALASLIAARGSAQWGALFHVLVSLVMDGGLIWAGAALPSRRPSLRRWTSIVIGVAIAVQVLTLLNAIRMGLAIGMAPPIGYLIQPIIAVAILALALAYQIRRAPADPILARREVGAIHRDHPVIKPRITDGPDWHQALLASLRETGVQETPRPSRWPIALALIAVLAVGQIVPRIISPLISGAPLEIQSAIWLVVSLVLLVALGVPGANLRRQTMQLRARRVEQSLNAAGAKRPIFYLRSFALDQVLGRPSVLELLTNVNVANPEQQLTRVLGKSGPVIAIGRPGEVLPALGAARFYVADDRWQEKVADVATVAQLVVWASGTTLGLQWEITHLIASLPPEKLVLWAHPHLLDLDEDEREAEWARFVDGLGTLFPKPMPKPLGRTRFFAFGPGFEPIPFAGRGGGAGPAQSRALRKLLIAKGVPPFDPIAVGKRHRRGQIIAGVAGGVAGLILIAALAAFWSYAHTAAPPPVGWNLLAEELMSDEFDSDSQWDATQNAETTVPRTPDEVKQKLQDTVDSLKGHWFASNWNHLPPGRLPALSAAAKAYASAYNLAQGSQALAADFDGQGEPLALTITSPADYAPLQARLNQLRTTLAAAKAPWTANQVATSGWTYSDRLRAVLDARDALMVSEADLLSFFSQHPDWSLSQGDDGSPVINSADQVFLAQAPDLLAARNQAATRLKQAEAAAEAN